MEGCCIQESPSWLDKCPVCKSGNLSAVSRKKFFGLAKDENIECNRCQAKFSQEGTKYRLSYVTDASNLIWQEYSSEPLEEREWKNIADGGLSDNKQSDADMEAWMTWVKNGNVPRLSSESPVILKKNEELIFSVPNLAQLTDLLDQIASMGYKPKRRYLVTMHNKTRIISKRIAESVRELFGEDVFKVVIPDNVKLVEAPSYGKPVYLHSPDLQEHVVMKN